MGDHRLDFIIIGVPRAATTWLARVCGEHPAIYVPEQSPNFWSGISERSESDYWKLLEPDPENVTLVGEKSATYFVSSKAYETIKLRFNDVKIILSVRHPLERAVSHFRLRKATGQYSRDLTFEDAVFGQERDELLIEYSSYGKYIPRWLEVVGRDRFKLVVYDQIKEKPGSVVADIYRFLNVSEGYSPVSLEKRYAEATAAVERPWLSAIRRKWNSLMLSLMGRRWARFKEVHAQGWKLKKVLSRVEGRNAGHRLTVEIDPETARRFMEEIGGVTDSVLGLTSYDISGWYSGDSENHL